MNNSKQHEKLINDIFNAIAENETLRKNIRLWKRSVGAGNALGSGNFIRFGIPGESDIQGIIAPDGKYLCIEVKSGGAVLSVDQKRWRDVMIRFGAVYILARDAKQVEKELYEEVVRKN